MNISAYIFDGGCVISTLHTPFKIFTKPILTYCNVALKTPTQSQINIIERIQNVSAHYTSD